MCYIGGTGFVTDPAQGAHWFLQAATQGMAASPDTNIGMMYF